METCQTQGCDVRVTRKGHTLCYTCWKKSRGVLAGADDPELCGEPRAQVDDSSTVAESLSSTKLGKALGISNRRVNLILAELGWIEKFTKGWKPTPQGEKHGGIMRTMSRTGVPFVMWPKRMLENKVFLAVAQEMGGGDAAPETEVSEVPEASRPIVEDARTRFPAKYRTADGHYVRSRAELSIDNWLYMQGIVHAYERKLPVEEDAYCDFYLLQSKVYIEYWGMEKNPTYAKRMAEKKTLYATHGLILVELGDAELENLDDNLPRLLIPHGVNCS